MQEYVALTFDVPFEKEEILNGYFLANYDVQGFEENEKGNIVVYVPFDPSDPLDLSQFLSSEKEIKLLKRETLEDKDWNAAWEAQIEPLQVTSELVITPSWKVEEAKKIGAKCFLIIDPKMSFGTGHHETTRLCLKALEHLDCNGK